MTVTDRYRPLILEPTMSSDPRPPSEPFGAPSRPPAPTQRRHVTLVPISDPTTTRFRVDKGPAPETGDFLHVQLVDGSDPSLRWAHKARPRDPEPPPPPLPPLFKIAKMAQRTQQRTFTQEHSLETSPWWQTISSARTRAPAHIAPLGAQPAVGSQTARATYDHRAFDWRLMLAAQRYSAPFADEMGKLSRQLAHAQAARTPRPTAVGALMGTGV